MDLLFIVNKAQDILGALSMILGGLITIALIIPGEQPEKFLQSALDFVKKLSRK